MPKKIFCAAAILLISASGGALSYAQTEIIRPRSLGMYGNASLLFQAPTPYRNLDGDKKYVYPFYQYMDLSAAYPEHNVFFNTFFRGREVLGGDQESLDVYNAFVQFSNTPGTYEVRLGRQAVTEGVNFVLMDGALVRLKPIHGLELTAYGGYQENDLQPEPERPGDSFGLFGVKLKTDAILGSVITVGYELYAPDDFSSRQFVNASFKRAVPYTDFADVYALAEIDVGEGNLALLTTGVGIVVLRSLYLNLEYDNYEMDKDRNEYKLDPIFDVFSVGRLQQARVGLTFVPTSYLEVKGSYSYSHYDHVEDESTNGNIAKLGFNFNFWKEIGLRAFQGFYYIDAGGDTDYAIGLNTSLYQEVMTGWELQFAFAYAYYDKITNQSGNAFSYILGSDYVILQDLVLRTAVEFNTNPDFHRDIRVDLGLSYYFSTSM